MIYLTGNLVDYWVENKDQEFLKPHAITAIEILALDFWLTAAAYILTLGSLLIMMFFLALEI